MKEVKSPKKPLLYYYSIVLIVILLFNWIVSPLLMQAQVEETDYGTFMRMIEEKNIGEVEVKDSEIIFTDKDETQIYKTGAMDDPTAAVRIRRKILAGCRADHLSPSQLSADGTAAAGAVLLRRPDAL